MRFLDPTLAPRRWLTLGLIVAGAIAGAVFGIALTPLGKIVTGAPPATPANYARNALAFGVMAGIISPMVTWGALRRAPLWRTIVEPLAYAVAGTGIAVLVGMPALILVLPPAGLGLGWFRLHRRYANAPAIGGYVHDSAN